MRKLIQEYDKVTNQGNNNNNNAIKADNDAIQQTKNSTKISEDKEKEDTAKTRNVIGATNMNDNQNNGTATKQQHKQMTPSIISLKLKN